MTATVVTLKPHKHYLKLNLEVAYADKVLLCTSCDGHIKDGQLFAGGTVETCNLPGIRLNTKLCKSCFTIIGTMVKQK